MPETDMLGAGEDAGIMDGATAFAGTISHEDVIGE
jgi:hypothetical protein